MFNRKTIGLLLLLITTAIVLQTTARADEPLWRDVSVEATRTTGERLIKPTDFRLVQVDLAQLERTLATAPLADGRGQAIMMSLPLPDGGLGRFTVTNAPIMEPELAARYPELQTYTVQGVDDPTATGRLDLTPAGFHAYVQSAAGDIYIDPYQTNDRVHYISYFKTNFVKPIQSFVEGMPEVKRDEPRGSEGSAEQTSASVGNVKRTYQIVISSSGEYADFICAQGGDCSNATAKRATAMAGIVTGMNRVTQIYERDLAISFVLVNNNDQVVFTDAASDPYTDGSDADSMINELPGVVNSAIQINDYDLGHAIGSGGGGGLASTFICGSSDHSDKASGATALGAPIGDPFWVDYTAHEIGHQFNADHSYNASAGDACTTRVGSTAYEPGSGSTIMSYAGICGSQDIQSGADAMFNAGAFDQIIAHVTTGDGSTCDEESATGNTAPTVEAGNNVTIPKETPFELVATASDSEQASSALTTSWEQFNLGADWSFDSVLPNTDERDNQARPIVRVHLPSTSNTRVIPALANILDGTYKNNGEDLPSIDQTMTFRATIRDNAANGGGIAFDTMQITVEDNAGPFRVTSHGSAASISGSTTVTWDVANTNVAPVNCANVDISLSTDGGANFSATLASGTSNDGSEMVTLPNVSSTTARIRVKCSNNIFFDINKADLQITPGATLDQFLYLPMTTR